MAHPSQQSAKRPATAALPSWPRFRLVRPGVCVVVGWHLTAGSARFLMATARLLALAAVIYIAWAWWHGAIPELLRQLALLALHALWQHGWRVEWPAVLLGTVYTLAWLVLALLLPLWRYAIMVTIAPLFWRRTAVRFTADAVTVGTLVRHPFDRAEADNYGTKPLGFALQPDPDLAWRDANNLPPGLATFYREVQLLVVQHGPLPVQVASFGAKLDAERFVHACTFALAYPLGRPQPPAEPQSGQAESPIEEDDDA